MKREEMIESIDRSIAKLHEAKALLQGSASLAEFDQSVRPKKKQLSPEGRARIAAAQRARWAKVKKALQP